MNSATSRPKPFPLPGATTHYARDRDFDVQHVKLELKVNPEEKKLEGTVHITFSALVDNLTRLEFDAVELDIKDVKLSAGKIASFEDTGRELIIYLDKALKASENLTISIRYSG